MFPRRLLFCLVAAGVLAVPTLAQEKKQAAAHSFKILAIRGSATNEAVSPELKSLAEKLKKQMRLKGYKLEGSNRVTVSAGAKATVDSISGYAVQVEPLGAEDKRTRFRVSVTKKGDKEPKLNTILKLANDEYQLIGGWKLDGDDKLIIAIAPTG